MNDRTSTDEELAQVMLMQQIEQIQAYMEKSNAKEKTNETMPKMLEQN